MPEGSVLNFGQDIPADATVKVIYNEESGDIISRYVTFTKICNDQMKKYGRIKKAVEETICICIDEDVLADYLKEFSTSSLDKVHVPSPITCTLDHFLCRIFRHVFCHAAHYNCLLTREARRGCSLLTSDFYQRIPASCQTE